MGEQAGENRTGHPAGLDRRLHAFVLDRLIGGALAAMACYAAYVLLVEPGHVGAGIAAAVGGVVLVGLALAVLTGLHGVSPGKAALGLRVVGGSTGEPVGLLAAATRALVLAVAGLPTCGLGLAVLALTALGDRTGRRRGWHDLVTGTVVLDARQGPERDQPAGPEPQGLVNLTALGLAPPPSIPPPSARPRPADTGGVGRPVSWRVTFDTGETLAVEGLALVGRHPEPRPGEPVRHLLPLRSEDRSLSNTQAQFQVVPDGALVVMDRGSTSGTVLVRRGAARRLPAGRPATLLHGDLVRFGDRTMAVAREA